MNELEKNKKIETLLEDAAKQLQPNLVFKAELEEKLRKTHKPRKTFSLNFNKVMPALTSVTVLGALVIFMLWIFQSVEPQNGVGSNSPFACPVTLPNGNVPPGTTQMEDPYSYGNGELWTSLWPHGKIVMENHNLEADGSYSMKWAYIRGVEGALTIEGRRLDADAEPLRAFINDGYGESGLQILALIFPTTGCWEVTAHVGESSLTFVTEVVYGQSTPEPNLEPQVIITPQPDTTSPQGTYSWRGTTVQLNMDLPDGPTEMQVYQAQANVPATVEDVRALAQVFGMNGEIYATPGNSPGTTGYFMVDGNRQLFVRSKYSFHYVPNHSAYLQNPFFEKNENAESMIAEFMRTYNLGENYKVEYAESYNGYYALPLDLNGYPLHLGYGVASGYLFRFTEAGLVGVETSLVGYEALGTASIISAEEAWQKVLNSTDGMGMQEAMFMSNNMDIQSWARQYPLNETVTVFGFISSTGRSVDGNPPLVTFDSAPATGNVTNVPENLPNTFVEATGQFIEEEGVRKFNIESWQSYDGYEEGIQGILTREGDAVYVTVVEGPKLLLPNVPDDLALPLENLFLTGVTIGDVFEWKSIDNRSFTGGGGGGGGGFYKVNISGVPIPYPTVNSPTPVPETIMPQSIDGARGTVSIFIYLQNDGSEKTAFSFVPTGEFAPYYELEGDLLEQLLPYPNMPIKIWGTSRVDQNNGLTIIKMDKFEVLFPDLKFQILKGTEKLIEHEGKKAILFTSENGEQYVELSSNCYDVINGDVSWVEKSANETVFIEALVIPDVSFAGYLGACVFQTAYGFTSNDTSNFEMPVTADKPIVIPELQSPGNSATIDRIDLVYYTRDLRFAMQEQLTEPQYIQPIWRFIGHYDDGNAFEILVQALTQEFLSPEPEQFLPPG